ncbi:MAG: hypothetical protein R2728_03010 [Chitinophagales bacterium]
MIKIWEMLLIVLLTFVAYGNTIKNDYNIDDAYIVPLDSQNDIIKEGVSAIPTLLTSRYNEGEGVTYGYRPMGKITMVFEYMFWGNNPHNSHVVNIILYAINIILLLVFLRMLTIIGINIPKEVIYMGLLLFLFHPIHTEVVASIKNREEILCFSFLIAALIFYLKFFKSDKWLFLIPSLIFLFLSVLSKETGLLVFPWMVLITVVGYKYKEVQIKGAKTILKYIGVFIIGLIIYNIVFTQFKGGLPAGDIPYSFEQNPYKFYPSLYSISNGVQTIFFYLKKLIIPFPLLFYYGYNTLPVQNWSMVLPYLGIVIMLISSGYIIRSFALKLDLKISFWMTAFAISILPFSNLLPPFYVTGIVGERLVYQASLGFCMIVALLIYNCANRFKPNVAALKKDMLVVGPILIAFLFLTIQRNTVWEDKRTLYEHDIKYLSNSARANFMMANHYMKTLEANPTKNKQPDVNKAKNYFVKAIDVYPEYSDAKIKLAVLYGQYYAKMDSAIYWLKSVSNDSSQYHLKSLELLGDIYHKEYSSEEQSLNYYLQYWNLDQHNKRVYQKLMNIYFKNLAYNEIIQLSQTAIQNNWVEGYLDQGDVYAQIGENEKAINLYNKAVEMGYNQSNLFQKIEVLKNNK